MEKKKLLLILWHLSATAVGTFSEESYLILIYVDFIFISRASTFVWSQEEEFFALMTTVLLLICLKTTGDVLSWEAIKPTKTLTRLSGKKKKKE